MEEKEKIIDRVINAIQEFEKHNEIKWDGDIIKSANNLQAILRAEVIACIDNIDADTVHKLADKIKTLK